MTYMLRIINADPKKKNAVAAQSGRFGKDASDIFLRSTAQ